MALIETNFIRSQEVYDRNTGESKVRYRSYDGNDRFIPVVEGEKGVPKTMVEVTHAELKAMRDGGKLTAGSLYRITDYNCTTTQENTQSAGHQFDIVLLALSENKLAEEGWAMMHDNDVYDVTFANGIIKKCYLNEINGEYAFIDVATLLACDGMNDTDFTLDDVNKTATCIYDSTDLSTENVPYNYFQNSNLSAWKVWYCLDNDKSRFAWADDSVDEGTGLPNGRGVIYRLIDEFNNDVAYDFKNIQYVRKLTDGVYDADNGTDEWCYTFNAGTDGNEGLQDASMMTGIYDTEADNEHECYNNRITNSLVGSSSHLYNLPNIICTMYYLNADSTINCSNNNFENCMELIGSSTLANCDFKYTFRFNISDSNGCTFIHCSSTINGDVSNPHIFISNKLVLTEE